MRRRRRAYARAVKRTALGTGLLLLVALGVGLSFAGSNEKIADGITIGGVDVGGLSPGEAVGVLSRGGGWFAVHPLVVHAGRRRFEITASELGAVPHWDAAVASARVRGDGFGPLRGFRRLFLEIAGAEVRPSASVSRLALKAWLGAVAERVDEPPRAAALKLRGLEPVIVAGRAGRLLERDAAAHLVAASFASFGGQALTLPFRIVAPRVTAADLRPLQAELRTALSRPVLLALGPARYRIARWRIAGLLAGPADHIRQVKIGGPGADHYFAWLKEVVARPALDARFAVSGSEVRIIPARDARSLDVRATARNLLASLLLPSRRVSKIAVVARPARRTTEEARRMGITALVSTQTMNLGGSGNWVHNATLAARLIDRTLIGPGRTFSFNETTGARTAHKGFEAGPVIIDDHVRNGIGGGVCEVSTAIFNAAFNAGLGITARTNHSLYISHYPQGRDAAVDYPDVDLKFVNDTGHWLLLRTFVGSSSLTVSLYGTPLHRRVISETAPLVETGPPPVKRVTDPTLARGMRIVEDRGEPARSTSVRRLVYDQRGTLLHDDVWYSSYHAEPRVIRVGTRKGRRGDVRRP